MHRLLSVKAVKQAGASEAAFLAAVLIMLSALFFLLPVSHVVELTRDFDSSVNQGVQCMSCGAAYPIASRTVITDSDPNLNLSQIQSLLRDSTPLNHLSASTPPFPSINAETHPPPYHLLSWVASNRHLLAPPVGNRMVHGSGCQFKVMVVGGPNERTDYHIDDGEEVTHELQTGRAEQHEQS